MLKGTGPRARMKDECLPDRAMALSVTTEIGYGVKAGMKPETRRGTEKEIEEEIAKGKRIETQRKTGPE